MKDVVTAKSEAIRKKAVARRRLTSVTRRADRTGGLKVTVITAVSQATARVTAIARRLMRNQKL